MVLAIKIPIRKAQKIKQILMEKNLLSNKYRHKKENDYLILAINDKIELDNTEIIDVELEESYQYSNTFKEVLTKILSKEELEIAKTAYDIVGTIAIIEIPQELEAKEKLIGETLLHNNKNIATVLKKDDKHDGVYRTQKMKFLAGINTTLTEYHENNCRFIVDVEKVYFSVRLSTERKRIMEKVKSGEKILVMFSGAGPYTCVLAKNTNASEVVGVEINPQGHEFAELNSEKNKLTNVRNICGDAKEIVPKLNEKFDRIIMPLPKTADEFLPSALSVSKQNTIIHFYAFLHEDEFDTANKMIEKACDEANLKYEILEIVKSGQQSPRTYRICVDFRIL